MPTPLHLKPPFAAWHTRERTARKWKPRDVVTALAAQQITITEGTVKVWESNANRKPHPLTIEALERIYDSRAPKEERGAGAVESLALVAAIERQAAAIEALAGELRLGREQHSTEVETILQALGSLGANLARSETRPDSGREARVGTR